MRRAGTRQVVATSRGGSAGGGAQLNELGGKLLKTYRALEGAANRSAEEEVRLLSALVRKDAATAGHGKASRRGR
jgi:molybdate transport system regulatory protein